MNIRRLLLTVSASGLLLVAGCGDNEEKQQETTEQRQRAETFQAEGRALDEQYRIEQQEQDDLQRQVDAELVYADYNLIVTKSTITPKLESEAIEIYCNGLVASVKENKIYCGAEDSE